MIMKKLLFFCIILIFGVDIAGAESIITVTIDKTGNASWTMEKRITLSITELSEWESTLNHSGQIISRYRNITEFETIIELSQNRTLNFSNRTMEIKEINKSYEVLKTISGGYGIIRYSFVWTNFSTISSGNIYIGDAFPEGLLLSSDNLLIIGIPEGYYANNATPIYDKIDGNRLIWSGTLYQNFSTGEPAIELFQKNVTSNVTEIVTMDWTEWITKDWTKWISVILLLFIIIIALIAFHRFIKKKRSENVSAGKIAFYEDMVTQVPKEMVHELSEIPGAWTKIVESVQKEFGNKSIEELENAAREQRLKNMGYEGQELTMEDLEDEEMIRQFLLRSGGQAYQSDIVDHSGLSKSKISLVLSKMKDNGMIIKIRKGKENLIRLVKPKDENNNKVI